MAAVACVFWLMPLPHVPVCICPGAQTLVWIQLTSISGYVPSPFPAKGQQQQAVAEILTKSGFMPPELVNGEVDWFYNSLGIDNGYL